MVVFDAAVIQADPAKLDVTPKVNVCLLDFTLELPLSELLVSSVLRVQCSLHMI